MKFAARTALAASLTRLLHHSVHSTLVVPLPTEGNFQQRHDAARRPQQPSAIGAFCFFVSSYRSLLCRCTLRTAAIIYDPSPCPLQYIQTEALRAFHIPCRLPRDNH